MTLHNLKGKLFAPVFVNDALVVHCFGTAGKPAFVYTHVAELSDEYTGSQNRHYGNNQYKFFHLPVPPEQS